MKIAQKLLFLIVTSILLTSCYAPLAVSNLTPLEKQEKKWHFGKEKVTNSHSGISVECMFHRSIETKLFFEVEITNQSDSTILIDPYDFYYTSYTKDTLTLIQFVHANDPELELLKIDKALSINSAKAKNNNSADLLNSTMHLAADVAELTSDKNMSRTKRSLSNQKQSIDNKRVYFANKNMSLNDQRNFWENNLIRKTELPPGYTLKGLVVFKRSPKAKFYGFNFKIEDKTYEFDYTQEMIYP
ncbi:hypothetical protein [Aureivirga sp. CE67]|uniref:hypothetical protein n=1 Tax=Aureivirga sp. CE67 TaxID=1788983 RepID=UPI0018CBCCF0|nr:hypothetical protein [Aureivirga sp. CE67]